MNVQGLAAKLTRMAAALEKAAERARDDAAEKCMARARDKAPVRTGALRASIRVQQGKVYTNCPYAAIVEFGSAVCPPRPFMQHGESREEYRRLCVQALQNSIR